MTSARITKSLLLFAVATTSFCAAQQPQNQSLQLTIRLASSKPTFQVELRNAGKEPLHLKLGPQYPGMQEVDAIHLVLTGAKGRTFSLGVQPPNAEGGDSMSTLMELSSVTLQPGETHSLTIDLRNYGWSLPPFRSFATGQYTIHAFYTGEDLLAQRNHTTSQYWIGTVTSNTLSITIPAF